MFIEYLNCDESNALNLNNLLSICYVFQMYLYLIKHFFHDAK